LGVMTDSGPSVEIQELFLADQKEHLDVPTVGTAEYSALRERDRLRRESGLKLLMLIMSPSAEDLYRVAWVRSSGRVGRAARPVLVAVQSPEQDQIMLAVSSAQWV
jgi:hypothetical protein